MKGVEATVDGFDHSSNLALSLMSSSFVFVARPLAPLLPSLIFVLFAIWLARYSRGDESSSLRYRQEVALHRDAGLNLIRVWGGGLAERPEFFDACDELGVLVHHEVTNIFCVMHN